MHKALFWVAVAVLQLDEVNLYSAGTALLEQNLHTLDSMRVFNDKVRRSRLLRLLSLPDDDGCVCSSRAPRRSSWRSGVLLSGTVSKWTTLWV